jgi:hypothetical protein
MIALAGIIGAALGQWISETASGFFCKIADDLGVPELEYMQAIRHDASWVN